MKYIFLDSNIFHDHWFLTSADFVLLANFIQNSQSALLVSEIVCREVQNNHDREQSKLIEDLKKNFEKVQKISATKNEFDFDAVAETYSFVDILKSKFEFLELLPVPNISHDIIVDRAINVVMPFRENEKGYRDTLIWLSIIDFLKTKILDDELIFVTKNSTDFYQEKEAKFHEHLLKDLKASNNDCAITCYLSLNDFIKKEVETNEHEFSNQNIEEQFIEPLSGVIQNEVAMDLTNIPSIEFRKVLDNSGVLLPYIRHMFDHDFNIDEGIEDGQVISYKRLSVNSLYVNYGFNLRRCTIDVTIPIEEYLSHKTSIDIHYNDYYLAEDEAHLLFFCRPEMTVSFIYHIDTRKITGFEILSFDLEKHRK